MDLEVAGKIAQDYLFPRWHRRDTTFLDEDLQGLRTMLYQLWDRLHN